MFDMANTQMKLRSPWNQGRWTTQRKPFYEGSLQVLRGHSAPIRLYRSADLAQVLSRCWQVEGEEATIAGMKRTTLPQRPPATDSISYAGYPFPPDVISYAVWLY